MTKPPPSRRSVSAITAASPRATSADCDAHVLARLDDQARLAVHACEAAPRRARSAAARSARRRARRAARPRAAWEGRRSVSSTAMTVGPVTRRALGPTMTRPVAPATSISSCFSRAPLPPVNGSASATTFQGPVSAHAIDSARSGSSRTTRERSGTSASRARASSWRRAPWAASCRSRVMPSRRHGAAPPPGQRHLAHEAVGRAVEQLLVLDEHALDLGLEGPRDAHGRLQRDGARVRRAQLQHHPAAVLSGLGDVRDHSVSLAPSPPLPAPLAKPRPRSANDLELVFHQAVDGAGREASLGAALARLDAGQDLDALVDGGDGIDGELAVA